MTLRSQHGTLYTYKRSMERINTKQPERLQMLERQKYNPTTSDDPVIQDVSNPILERMKD